MFQIRVCPVVRFLPVTCLLISALGLPAIAQGEEHELLRSRLATLEQRHSEQMEALRVEYESRIRGLEQRVTGLSEDLLSSKEEERDQMLQQAITALSQEDRLAARYTAAERGGSYDNSFNPAIGIAADFLLVSSDRDDGFPLYNQFRLRSVELQLQGRVDHLASYHLMVLFDEEDVELEEAYVHLDDALPDTFELKVGKFNASFGKLSPLHEHDLPFVDHPQVLQEYLGGSLRTTGLELRHWFALGESHVLRWSLGFANSLDGDSHPIFGPAAGGHHHEDEEEEDAFGKRQFRDYAWTARASAIFEIGEETLLQLGLSGAYAPRERAFGAHSEKEFAFSQLLKDGKEELEAKDLRRLILGADITLSSIDSSTGSGFVFHGEALLSRLRFEDAGTTTSFGFHSYFEYLFDKKWSAGLSGGFYEHAEDDSESSWDIGLFLTYRINEFHRLRLEARHFDDPDFESYGLMLQYTIFLGHHKHGIAW